MKQLPVKQRDALLTTLQARFEANMKRHPGIEWSTVRARLELSKGKLPSLDEMEKSGGEPDVVGVEKSGVLTFVDCSAQSAKGRRSVCYDRAAPDARPLPFLSRPLPHPVVHGGRLRRADARNPRYHGRQLAAAIAVDKVPPVACRHDAKNPITGR